MQVDCLIQPARASVHREIRFWRFLQSQFDLGKINFESPGINQDIARLRAEFIEIEKASPQPSVKACSFGFRPSAVIFDEIAGKETERRRQFLDRFLIPREWQTEIVFDKLAQRPIPLNEVEPE